MLISLIALFTRMETREEQAYRSMINTCADAMYRYGIRFVPDNRFVRDCIQDVFVDLWDREEKLKEVQLKSCLFKALRCRILQQQSAAGGEHSLGENYIFAMESDVAATSVQKELLYLRLHEGLHPDQIASIMNLNTENLPNLTLNGHKMT
jgi:DNA-directed RNA polymerase specialized sigma24 family protein